MSCVDPPRAYLPSTRALAFATCAALAVGGCGRIGYGPSDAADAFDASVSDAGSADAAEVLDAALDASSVDAGAEALPCAARYVGRRFCDDFDDALDDTWVPVGEDATSGVTITDAVAYRGTSSLEVRALGAAGMVGVFAPVFVPGDTELWFRAHYRLDPSLRENVELHALVSDDPGDGSSVVVYLADPLADSHSHGLASDYSATFTAPIPLDRWACLELHVSVGELGAVEVYLDGAIVLDQRGVDTRLPRGYGGAFAGFRWRNLDNLLREDVMHVDDVVMDTVRVGCE